MIDVFDKYYNSGVGIKLVLLKNTSFIEINEIILHIVLTVFHYLDSVTVVSYAKARPCS